jgi:heme/copper-type cytochrome/quinol oxidase subunit 2
MNTLMWACAAVAIAIFGAIIHSVATFRSAEERAGNYQRRTLVEVVWAMVPILIVIAAAAPSFRMSDAAPVAVAASE